MNSIYLANGVNYITPITIKFFKKFGFDPITIDEAPNRAGFSDESFTDPEKLQFKDIPIVMNFDRLIAKVNTNSKLFNNPKIIGSRLGYKVSAPTNSKYNVIQALLVSKNTSSTDGTTNFYDPIKVLNKRSKKNSKVGSKRDRLFVKIPHTVRYEKSNNIVKFDRSAGSKYVGNLSDKLGLSNKDINSKGLLIQERAEPCYTKSGTLAIACYRTSDSLGNIKRSNIQKWEKIKPQVKWNWITYPNYTNFTYDNQFDYSVIGNLSPNILLDTKFLYLSKNVQHTIIKSQSYSEDFQIISEALVEDLGMIDGTISVEFLYVPSKEDPNLPDPNYPLFWVEADFRLCDINWMYATAQKKWIIDHISYFSGELKI